MGEEPNFAAYLSQHIGPDLSAETAAQTAEWARMLWRDGYAQGCADQARRDAGIARERFADCGWDGNIRNAAHTIAEDIERAAERPPAQEG